MSWHKGDEVGIYRQQRGCLFGKKKNEKKIQSFSTMPTCWIVRMTGCRCTAEFTEQATFNFVQWEIVTLVENSMKIQIMCVRHGLQKSLGLKINNLFYSFSLWTSSDSAG